MAKLDKIDLKILAALQKDGRITKLRLAEAVHLSPSACWERLSRLERDGVIAGYGARIDLDKVGRVTTVLVEVALKSHRLSDFQRFEAAVVRESQIVACDATGGGIDYVLRVVVRDVETYQRLIDRLLAAEVGIERYFTYIVTRTIKASEPDVGPLRDEA